MTATDYASLGSRERRTSRQGENNRQTWVQPLATSRRGGAGDPSLHRHGLWLLGVLGPTLGRRMVAAATRRAKPVACPGDATTFAGKLGITGHALFATDCDWTQFDLGWMFTLFFVVLGSSAAIWGGWLEQRRVQRKAGLRRSLCAGAAGWSFPLFGVYVHQLWLMWLGLRRDRRKLGLGLGHIRRSRRLANGFRTGAAWRPAWRSHGVATAQVIGSPLAPIRLINDDFLKGSARASGCLSCNSSSRASRAATSVGVWETFLVLTAGCISCS